MSGRTGFAIAALCAVVASASRAGAQDVSVAVEGGCVERAALEAALELELASGWTIVAEGTSAEALRVEVAALECAEAIWTARVVDGGGVVLRGPAELAMASFAPASRPRIAALWIAEWLATVGGRAEAGGEAEAETEAEAAGAESEAAEAEAGTGTGTVTAEAEAETGAGRAETETGAGRAEAGVGAEIGGEGGARGGEADEPPLLVRFVAFGSFRQVPDTPASLAGGEIGLQLARGGEIGFGLELSGAVDGGKQWSYDLLVARGSLSAFVLFAPATWLEVDLGARASLEYLAEYTRNALRERLFGQLHGTVGGFARAMLFVMRELAVAVDVELGGALAPVSYRIDQPPGYELPSTWDDLLGGFYFAVRAGVVVQ